MSSPEYASLADLTLYASVRPEVLAEIPSEKKTAELNAASGLAHSYVLHRYPAGLTSWGPTLRKCVVAIACEELLRSRGYDPANVGDGTIVLLADRQRAWLRDVAQMRASIPDAVPASEAQHRAASGATLVSSDTRGW